MDPLTHTLTGLALSRAGLNRRSAYATPILMLAASAPDIDILAWLAGPAAYLHYHRHLPHAFVAIPFLALLPVLASLSVTVPLPRAESFFQTIVHALMEKGMAIGTVLAQCLPEFSTATACRACSGIGVTRCTAS